MGPGGGGGAIWRSEEKGEGRAREIREDTESAVENAFSAIARSLTVKQLNDYRFVTLTRLNRMVVDYTQFSVNKKS